MWSFLRVLGREELKAWLTVRTEKKKKKMQKKKKEGGVVDPTCVRMRESSRQSSDVIKISLFLEKKKNKAVYKPESRNCRDSNVGK